jgi:hypothetical protein
MVALVLRGLGVPMGEGLAENHEDLDFYNLLHSHNFSPRSIAPLVSDRNSKFIVWGFKSPLLLEEGALRHILPLLRNPILIIVFRNPLAVAESREQRDGVNVLKGLLTWDRLFGHVRDAMEASSCPVLGVNYEAAIRRPAEFIREISNLLNLPAIDADNLATELVNPDGGYRMLPSERWMAELREPRPVDAEIGLFDPKPGAEVALLGGGVRYIGNVFFGPDHLVLLSPPAGSVLGVGVRIRIKYPESRRPDLTDGGHNVFFSFGKAFSLGLAKFISRKDDGKVLVVSSRMPLEAISVGIADDREFGIEKDLPSFALLL